jgi:hypothetical protein
MRDDQDLTRGTEDLDRNTRVIMNCMDECGMPLTACGRCILDLTLYRASIRTIERSLLDLFRVTAGNNRGFRPALIALMGWSPTLPRLFVYSDFIG